MESETQEIKENFVDPLFQDRTKDALRANDGNPNAPERSFPADGVDLVELYYYFMRESPEYDAERNYFSKIRSDFLKLITHHDGLRAKVRSELLEQCLESFRNKQHPFDDGLIEFILRKPQGKEKLAALGVTEDEMWYFMQSHPFIDKRWLKNLLKEDSFQNGLRRMKEDAVWLKDHDITAKDLQSKWRDLDRGDGSVLLWAMANYRGTRIQLSEAILEKWRGDVRRLKHLGRFLKEDSNEILSFLVSRSFPLESAVLVNKKGETIPVLVTKKFLRELSQTHPQIFDEFVEREAQRRRAAEFNAMAGGRATVSGKRSQWWLEMFERHCNAQKRPQDYQGMVLLLAWAKAERDIELMKQGKVPLGYNVHHVSPLSNFFYEKFVTRLREKHAQHIQDALQRGENLASYLQNPSTEMARRLAELGVISSTKRWNAFVNRELSLDSRWTPYLNGEVKIDRKWLDDASRLLKEKLFQAGLFEMPSPKQKTNDEGKTHWEFDSDSRAKLTRAGLHPRHYVQLLQASMDEHGKFDRQKYNQCAMNICRDIVVNILAEERAHKDLAEQGLFGGNQSGLYLNQDSEIAFNKKRCNLVLANSSKAHPHWNVHAIIHVLMDLQIDSSHHGAERNIHACIPHDVIVTGPLNDKGLWDAAMMLSKSFYTEGVHRASWWMLFEHLLEPYLPKDCKYGSLPARGIPKEIKDIVRLNCKTDSKKKELFILGKKAGEYVARKKLGEIPIDAPTPWMPENYSVEFHAGLRTERNRIWDEARKKQKRNGKSQTQKHSVETAQETIPQPMQRQREKFMDRFSMILSAAEEVRDAVMRKIATFPGMISDVVSFLRRQFKEKGD
ncbi:MAG: hypothetical protein ACOY3I_04765 [Verrucomicrobiota bacterium]